MSYFHEAGVFSLLALGAFVVGLGVTVWAKDRAGQLAPRFAAAVMGLGMLGSALGQRLVDNAVQRTPELAEKVMMLSVGTRETSSNLLLAGGMALLLLLVGVAISALSPRAS